MGEDPDYPTRRLIPFKKDAPRINYTELPNIEKRRLMGIVKKEQDNLIKELEHDPFDR